MEVDKIAMAEFLLIILKTQVWGHDGYETLLSIDNIVHFRVLLLIISSSRPINYICEKNESTHHTSTLESIYICDCIHPYGALRNEVIRLYPLSSDCIGLESKLSDGCLLQHMNICLHGLSLVAQSW